MSIATQNTELSTHLSDLNALLNHFKTVVHEQVEGSKNEGKMTSLELNQRLLTMLERHSKAVAQVCSVYCETLDVGPKEVFTSFLGTAAGIYNRLRDYPESKALRDNYTALTLLAASLTSLKAYGLMIGKEDVSKMAYDCLAEVCPFIVELSRRMPEVVVRETAEREGLAYDPAVVTRVSNAVARCWGA